MKRVFIVFTVISFLLIGCSHVQNNQIVTTNTSLHNYDFEMIKEALKNHPDFPTLTLEKSSEKVEVTQGENNYSVTYSWKTEVDSHGPTVSSDQEDKDTEVWEEASSADYYITLIKEWETEEGNVKSYWKYKYNPQKNVIELIDSENNDNKIS